MAASFAMSRLGGREAVGPNNGDWRGVNPAGDAALLAGMVEGRRRADAAMRQ